MKGRIWLLFVALGVLIMVFAAYNLAFGLALDPSDPNHQLNWLTDEAEVLDFAKLLFRAQGAWQLVFGLLVTVTAWGGLRTGQRWAWIGLWSVPVALVLTGVVMPWLAPFLLVLLAIAAGGLLISRPDSRELGLVAGAE